MYVSNLNLRNIRSFSKRDREVSLAFKTPDQGVRWNVIAGPNGSGKSTLLEAIALVLAGPDVAIELQERPDLWITHCADQAKATVEVQREPCDAFYYPEIPGGGGFDTGEEPRKLKLQLRWSRIRPKTKSVKIEGNSGDLRTNKNIAQYGPWIVFDQPPGWYFAAYGPYRRVAATSMRRGREEKGTTKQSRQQARMLFSPDAATVDPIDWLVDLHLTRLEEGEDSSAAKLLDQTLRILSDNLLPSGTTARRVDRHGLWLADGAELLPLSSFSDGFSTVTGLVLELIRSLQATYQGLEIDDDLRVQNTGVVLIDEIEAHLHPSWQREIGDWLKDRFPRLQFIVTTHSPFIVQQASVHGLFRLNPLDQDPVVERPQGQEFLRTVNGTANDVFFSEIFQLDAIRSPRAMAKLEELSKLAMNVLAERASEDEVARFEELRKQFPASVDVELLTRS